MLIFLGGIAFTLAVSTFALSLLIWVAPEIDRDGRIVSARRRLASAN